MSHRQAVEDAIKEIDFESNQYQLVLKTSEGDIRLDMLPELAPNHCSNMIGLAESGFYNDGIFHRVISGFMIQGGCPEGTGTGGPGYTIDAEFSDTPHVPGVLSMARTNDPDSAGSQFFICLEKHASLDGQYTVFGKTADEASMKVVQKIGGTSTDSSDRPLEPIAIIGVEVVTTPK